MHLRSSRLLFVLTLVWIAPGAWANDCVGDVIPTPQGLIEISDAALLASAIGAPLASALCKGKVFQTTKPMTVYRVWDASKSYTMYGKWWTFDLPKGPRDMYRVKNDICPEWSPLDKLSSCTIKVGSKIVVGPSQSAKCADGSVLPASAANQVYIPNDSRNNVLYVENCSAGTTWP